LTRYSALKIAARLRTEEPVMAAATWIAIQRELRAGTSGPAGTRSTIPARPIASTAGSSTNTPRGRTAGRRATHTRKAVTVTMPTITENSYMLPQGTRWAARARATAAPTLAASPATVTATPATPTQRTR
jgi:hypothetical protein